MDVYSVVVIVCMVMMSLLKYSYNVTRRNCKLNPDDKKTELYMLCVYCMCMMTLCASILYIHSRYYDVENASRNHMQGKIVSGDMPTSILYICFTWVLHVIYFEETGDETWPWLSMKYAAVQEIVRAHVICYSMHTFITVFGLEHYGVMLAITLACTIFVCGEPVFKVVNPFSWLVVLVAFIGPKELCRFLKRVVNKIT
jgi:hypothetical protein